MIVDHWVLVVYYYILCWMISVISCCCCAYPFSRPRSSVMCKDVPNCKVVGVRKITQNTSGWWGGTQRLVWQLTPEYKSKQYDAKNLQKEVHKSHWFPPTDSLSYIPKNVNCSRFEKRYKSLSSMKQRISWKKFINLIDSQIQILSSVYPKMEIAEGFTEVLKLVSP